MLLTWAPDVLRAAGLTVQETAGWRSRSHGQYPDSIAGYWHHDASPPGDSPGVLDWMLGNWDRASANFWVTRQGVWVCVGAGVSWHAGSTAFGHPTNMGSFGVETDQTINEEPSPAMLQSVRAGFAALLKHMGRGSNSLYFHKTSAYPLGRKVDPWKSPASADKANWPGELQVERTYVQRLIDGAAPDVSTIVAPPAPAPAPTPVVGSDWLRRGFSGARVRLLQERLFAHGANIVVDGDFGPKTDELVRAFQRSKGLTVDGIVDPKTWDAVHAAPVSTPSAPFPGTKRQGSTGAAVKAIQDRLVQRGFLTAAKRATGYGTFGPATESAVGAFQRSKGLVQDGIVGPNTWKALHS